ncbi:hypothetical protein Tco_1511518 [Tanacetum coccineum]
MLGFSNSLGGNPTPTSESFTSEFILEEIEAYLKDDSISPKIDLADCNPEEDICLIEKLLNNDPFQIPPMDLKQSEVTEAKSSIEEPPKLELKDLSSHLKYAFLEENNKLPVIIAKGLKNDEKDALLKVYALELLGFPNSSGGNPTPTSEPFTSEFILEEIEAYLKDDSISPEIDHADCNPEEDICLIEKLLNDDPFQHPLMDLKQSEVTEAKSLIEESPELELKDLPSHLEYAFLEENDKLPVIIAKGLKNVEKYALLKVLKSHKWAIAWKITAHKILMDDDYKPTVQSQRRVNPKIHKKGGITVVANEENELILTRLVTGWRVWIDYRKLNEAT